MNDEQVLEEKRLQLENTIIKSKQRYTQIIRRHAAHISLAYNPYSVCTRSPSEHRAFSAFRSVSAAVLVFIHAVCVARIATSIAGFDTSPAADAEEAAAAAAAAEPRVTLATYFY